MEIIFSSCVLSPAWMQVVEPRLEPAAEINPGWIYQSFLKENGGQPPAGPDADQRRSVHQTGAHLYPRRPNAKRCLVPDYNRCGPGLCPKCPPSCNTGADYRLARPGQVRHARRCPGLVNEQHLWPIKEALIEFIRIHLGRLFQTRLYHLHPCRRERAAVKMRFSPCFKIND